MYLCSQINNLTYNMKTESITKRTYEKPQMRVYAMQRPTMLQVTSRSYDPTDDNPFGNP